jgi:hypothetical protein
MSNIKVGDFAEFKGYEDGSVEPVLQPGQKITIEKVLETEEGLVYNVRPVFDDGTIDEDAYGDQIFADELELIEPAKEPATDAENEELSPANDAENTFVEPDREPAQDYDDEVNHDPVVIDLIRGTNNLTELAYDLYSKHEELYYKLGGILVDIKNRKLYTVEGYEDTADGFIEYVKDHIGPRKRSAYYLMSTYKHLREADLTSEDLRGIGWTKVRVLKDLKGDKLLEWIEKAKTMTRAELEEALQGQKKENGSTKERFYFSFQEDAAQLVHQALDYAMDQVGEDKNRALELIITNYLVTEVGVEKVVNGEDQPEERNVV